MKAQRQHDGPDSDPESGFFCRRRSRVVLNLDCMDLFVEAHAGPCHDHLCRGCPRGAVLRMLMAGAEALPTAVEVAMALREDEFAPPKTGLKGPAPRFKLKDLAAAVEAEGWWRESFTPLCRRTPPALHSAR